MVLMIDNYDSFTYNIVQYCRELGADLKVIRNDELTLAEIRALKPERIIFSPGPSTPNEAGVTLEVIEAMKGEVPFLGVCLGHQAIAQAFGGEVVRAGRMMHGKTSMIRLIGSSPLFAGLPETFRVTRYHSLTVKQENLPAIIKPTAYSEDDHEIMALEIEGYPIYGVQFHPESIMSEHGHAIFRNFLEIPWNRS